MIRRILAAVAIALGLAAIALGVASATVWRSADEVVASTAQPAAPVVLVQPGVLGLVEPEVTVTATAAAPDQSVVVALARTADAVGWIGTGAHELVSGLSSWSELRTEVVAGDEPLPNPAGSDLWLVEHAGTGQVEFTLRADPGQVVLLAASDGTAPAPRITLTWQVAVTTPYLIPLVVLGGVLLLAGLGLLLYDSMVRREVRVRRDAMDKRANADVIETSIIPAALQVSTEDATDSLLDTAGLTRRQRRELERRLKESNPRVAAGGPMAGTAGMGGAGIVPGVANPEVHRALRYVDMPAPAAEGWRTDRAAAGPAAGAGVVPGGSAGARARGEELADRLADAGAARGSAIVPGSRAAAAAAAEKVPQLEETPGRVSWRTLWGVGPGTEEK